MYVKISCSPSLSKTGIYTAYSGRLYNQSDNMISVM